MARLRTIKPEFWTDDAVTDCSLIARLLFIGIWNFADDYGNLDRSAKQIKAKVFPLDDIDCEPLLVDLITHGLLIEYSVSGKKYLHIPGFTKHQLINRPSSPVCPAYEDSVSTQGVLSEDSVSTHSGGIGKEGKGKEGGSTPPRKRSIKTPIPADFSLDQSLTEYTESRLPGVDAPAFLESFKGKAMAKGWVYANWRQAYQDHVRSAAPGSGHWSSGQYPKRAGGFKWQ